MMDMNGNTVNAKQNTSSELKLTPASILKQRRQQIIKEEENQRAKREEQNVALKRSAIHFNKLISTLSDEDIKEGRMRILYTLDQKEFCYDVLRKALTNAGYIVYLTYGPTFIHVWVHWN